MKTPTNASGDVRRVEYGDWQTPDALAADVLKQIRGSPLEVGSVLEPTCGRGAFLKAAAVSFPGIPLMGFDISRDHIAFARSDLPVASAHLEVADFFRVNWEKVLQRLPEPILILGNPPWVTNSALGALEAGNLPAKANFKGHSGLDAMTGKSNFDISEWMLLRLLEAVGSRKFVLAMLCKASVARKIMEWAASHGRRFDGSVRTIDARLHFAAAVDAVLLTVRNDRVREATSGTLSWAVYPALDAAKPTRHMGVVGEKTCSDLDGYHATRELEGVSEIEWRSGVKHDCARVMELDVLDDALTNGFGERVRLEREYLYPLLKGSDLANGRVVSRRRVIVTQRRLGDDTSEIEKRAPATWHYLLANEKHLEARKSSIYRDRPSFAMFGVGEYSFAPYKVAICGLYKRLVFTVVEPIDEQPVMLDDTAYFLPCDTREEAEELGRVLNGRRAKEFFQARVFWDAKRPISKALLQSLSIEALLRREGKQPSLRFVRARQQVLAL